ncbi:hypothetical protein [Ancylobacter aquaticus]|uniref:hypothetical protein n=1 Tax=Ancylobacter aquaticus TaxID=100 RepID=UPI001FDF7FC9|nr:hypothetical protein [Ancylobacter aquaticus]
MGIGDGLNGDVVDKAAGRIRRARSHAGRARQWLALPALALLLAGCAGNGIGGGDGNDGPMGAGNAGDQGVFGSSMETTTVAPTAGTAAVTPGVADASDFTCPPVQVRAGAAAWQVTEPSDGGVRYQATLGQFSRECRFTSPEMNMRVGIQGRVLLGPKGGPGKLTVPIRLAVVEEGPAPKSVWTKFYSVPVEVGAGVMQVDFGLVADDVNFPLPTPGLSERYIVYVGFDPQGKEEKPVRARPTTPRAQPQAQQAPRPAPAATAAPRATPVATPAPSTTPRQITPAASAAPRTSPSAPSATVQTAPATPAPATPAPAAAAATPAPAASAPAPSPDNSQTQWIGAPAPSTGGFSQ